MEFYAHKREMPDGAIVTQTVREHLVGTAQRAAQCLRQVGLEHAGYLAGLLHDLGKYTEAFQQYLDEGYYFFVTGHPDTDVAGQYFYAKTADEHYQNCVKAGWAS